jgi:penicillin-insensitive murein endopeptidase
MRAGRLFALFFALGLAGLALVRSDGLWPITLGFVQPLLAEPQARVETAQPAATQPPPDPKSAPVSGDDHPMPDFVPGNHTLTLSSDSSTDGDAAASEPDGEPNSTSKDASPAASDSKARAVTITTEPIPGTGASETASLKSDADAPKWPQFVGAKNLFGAVKKPAPLAARAIGYYARGCLSGAVALPIDGPAWQEMRLSRNRNWGHPQLISLIERFAKEAQKLDGWPGLLVGDIAQPRGGPMITGHASHQVGLDADIWLTPMPNRRLTRKEREDLEATSMLDKTGVAVDPKVFTNKQVALIKRAASYPEVERIFVHPAIKKALCKAAGTDRHWLGKVRPYYGHYYHFHVRIKCPADFGGCKAQTPPTGDDGCGKEVDQWLAKVIPAKTSPPVAKPPSVSVRPPASPVMLADLPPECRALLAAEPDPVPVPKEALMTKVAVRQALTKAAAARAAFAKAAGIAIVPASAATAAAHPALRPHIKKTTTAEKK